MTSGPESRPTVSEYIATQMKRVSDTDPEMVDVKFVNPDAEVGYLGKTNWFLITKDQFKQIERILTLGNPER